VSAETEDRIQAPGTAEERWAAFPALASLPRIDLPAVRSAVVIAAHPDDEVLGFGGSLAVLARAGARLRIVVLTDGEASHPHSAAAPADLAAVRRIEDDAGLSLLAGSQPDVVRLALPDSALAEHADVLAARLQELVAGFDVCAAPWSLDAHPDHEAAGHAAREACARERVALLEYPVWAWHWAVPGDPRVPWSLAARIDLPVWAVELKQAAIACHASQILPLGNHPEDAAILPPDELEHFRRDFEVVLR
jgi:LmbE family N-acetylglucosaminyl deacetylase